MLLIGKIRSVGYYSDGVDIFEIGIAEPKDLPVQAGKRLEYYIKIGNNSFKAGIRYTEKAGTWVSPDLYDIDGLNKKVRLSDILLSNGFDKNQKVNLQIDLQTKEITIEPGISSSKKLIEIPYLFGIGKSERLPFVENEEHIERVNELEKLPYSEELTDIFRHYVKNFIPTPEALENIYWMCTCFPANSWTAFRINIYWHEVFRVDPEQYENDEPSSWYVMLFTDKSILTKSAFKVVTKRLPQVKVDKDLYYDKGLDTQQPLLIPVANYFELMEDLVVVESIRQYNYKLMQKGKRVHNGHNYYLASLALK